jgi:sigma-B regulation protein RsbU (phosphoserine phosphatase)
MSAASQKKKSRSDDSTIGKWTVAGLLRLQLILIVLALLVRALFWALQAQSNFLLVLAITLVVGNLANAVGQLAFPFIETLPRPWDWVSAIALLTVVAVALAVGVQYGLFAIRHRPGARFDLMSSDVRFTVLVILVVNIVIYSSVRIYTETRTRLEAKNRELQGQVQFGVVQQQAQEADLESAHEIQMHLLPRDTPQIAGFQIACAWQPAKAVSGDYFDVFPLGEGKLALVLADVSGKGVAAALLMANLQASVRAFAQEGVTPSELCSRLNKVLCDSIAPGKFITMFYGIIDAATRKLHYENAGHCLPLMVRGDGSILMPASYSGVLGLFSHWMYQDNELQFESGDCLLIVTDGVLEAADRNDEEYGYQRLIALVQGQRQAGAAGAHALRKAILEDVSRFCEGVFQDDASLIVVTVS